MNATYRPPLFAYALFLALGVVFLLCLGLLHQTHPNAVLASAVAYIPYASAVLCGALIGYGAQVRPLIQLAVLGCGIAVGSGIINFAHEILIGPVDFSGFSGSAFVVAMSLPFVMLLCLAGGGIGIGLRRATHANPSLNADAHRRAFSPPAVAG